MSEFDAIYFYVFAVLALAGAAGVLVAQSPIRGAMGLLLLILSVAALFLQLHAEFLAAIQLIVYAGAIVVLFLFVIMLLGPSATVPEGGRGFGVRAFGGALFAVSGVAAIFAVAHAGGHAASLPKPDAGFGGIEQFGAVLFADTLVPFELSSALLMVAVIGAIAVARGRQGMRTLSKAEEAIARTPPSSEDLSTKSKSAVSGVFSHEIHLGGTKEHGA